MTDRDTQFAGFARALWQEIQRDLEFSVDTNSPTFSDDLKAIIARRAYDLVAHTLRNTGPYMIDCLSLDEQIAEIPDPTTLPEKSQQFEIPLIESTPLANGGVIEPGSYIIVGASGPGGYTMSLQSIDIEQAMNTPVFRGPLSELDEQIERETKRGE